ncbi:unnamed protein product [Rhodiola kirilowii]
MPEIPDPTSFNATALFGVSDGAKAGTSLIEGGDDAGAVGGAGCEAVGDEERVRVGEAVGGSDEGTGVGAGVCGVGTGAVGVGIGEVVGDGIVD